jgi:hypothetical protein
VIETSGVVWRKSRASGDTNCVEIAARVRSILVRESERPHGPMLAFSATEWVRFLARVEQ